MNEPVNPASADPRSAPPAVEGLREDIETTRGELAKSVDALSSKQDVKARASQRLRKAKARADDAVRRAGEAVSRARQRAPEPVQKAVDATGQKLGPMAHRTAGKLAPVVRKASDSAKAHRAHMVGGAAGLVLLFVLVRRGKSGDDS